MDTGQEELRRQPKLRGGPLGLGDPNDKSLRKVEVEVLIPKKMREKAKTDKCAKEVEDFNKCCKESSLSMVIKCRKENDALRDCLTRWYQDEDFKRECQEEYLSERTEFRRTGISPKYRKQVEQHSV
ncbi:COX assembly mitochondrial protein homolog [Schistocerca americana]|uniref:COX assembly mitochondrial protein homolog n=1 Tax=Schistocerca americana TaxID=7009 RepID=UPI001F4F3E2A|nr:COX assembly mitochondrial protein homolog [Schistocerca americana]XP_049951292.1 COX assembly mitochondrial protein homolog [Schistocerca serialis cubense]